MAYVSTRLTREIVIHSIVTIHYFEYPNDFVFLGESHDFWEFLYIDRGTVEVKAGEGTFTLGANDIIFHEPGEFHAFKALGEKPLNLVVCSFISFSDLMKSFRGRVFRLNLVEQNLISEVLANAKKCFSTPLNVPFIEQVQLRDNLLPGQSQLILQYLELFLLAAYHTHLSQKGEQDAFADAAVKKHIIDEELMGHVLQYLEHHITEKLTVKQISDDLSISRASLQKLFHDQEHSGVIEYFNLMKIDKAKELLRNGTMNITELAFYLSYSSLQYFSNKFKEATGMAPREYLSSVNGMTKTLRHSIPHFYTEHKEV